MYAILRRNHRESSNDALPTEGILLCRQLAAEFPNNADYKSRLAALLTLQAQHFSQKAESAKP